MKKISPLLIITFLLLITASCFAQIEGVGSRIATIGRYTANGIELRWMPDNKTILRLGFANSYAIERTELGANKFENIATVKAYSQAAWNSLIATEKDTVTKNHLEVAMEFLFVAPTDQKGISLDAGIAELNEKKSNEDMIYALFVLTAIKDGNSAEALGLGFLDKTAVAGKTYSYRIKLNATSSVYKIENSNIDIKAEFDANKYKNEVLVFTGDKKLSFAWTADPELAGYFVERAAEGATVFKPLNTVAIYASKGSGFEGPTNGSFDDDSLINYKSYTYRFYGNTAFGEKVLFAEVKGMPRDLTPPDAPILTQPKHVKPKEVLVGWDIHGNTTDLKGFIVARSNKDSGNFSILHKALLPVKTRNFTDTGFSLEENNYYIVYALDTAGNIGASYPGYVALVDSTPPAVPMVISAIIDSLGIVTITIKQGPEKDLKGYRIFKANSDEHELSAIQEAFKTDKADTALLKLVFSDTVILNSLTPKIYYKIKALDFNYNQSKFSELVAITKPDTIPPITPVFTNVVVTETQVELYFAPSESIDVKEQIIYRKTNADDNWSVLLKLDPLLKQAIDTNVKTGVMYYYSLRSVDESNLYSSFAHPVYGKPYDSGLLPPIRNLSSGLQNGKVMLQWEYPTSKKDVHFAVYKKDKNGNFIQHARVKEQNFTDDKTSKENVYAIKAISTDGAQSILSTTITQNQ